MKKNMLLLLGLFLTLKVEAQDSLSKAKKPLLSGYADLYYKYNFNKNTTDDKTSFTHSHNSFELGMISLKLQHDFKKVSFTGDIGFGKRAEEFSYNDEHTSIAIKQLFVSYSPVSWLKLTAGSFATYIGYELVDANLNRNYSMSYMFSYGPFFHTGLKAEVTVGDNTFMAGIFNPPDYKYAPFNSKKFIGGQWAFSPSGTGFNSYLNYLGGKYKDGVRNDQIDLVMTYELSDRFSLGYDGTYSRYKMAADPPSGWWGSALYVNADINDVFSLTLRSEYFNDRDKLKVFTDPEKFPKGGSIWSFTLSGNFKTGGLTLIPELRLDRASVPLFTRKNSSFATGLEPLNSSPDFLVAAVYSF